MKVTYKELTQEVKAVKRRGGKEYYQIDDGRLVPVTQCQIVNDGFPFQVGDMVQLVGRKCWERHLWPKGKTATVIHVFPAQGRLCIVTPESQRGDPDPKDPDIDGRWSYGVDACNWERVT